MMSENENVQIAAGQKLDLSFNNMNPNTYMKHVPLRDWLPCLIILFYLKVKKVTASC